jgi:hypothetical protein
MYSLHVSGVLLPHAQPTGRSSYKWLVSIKRDQATANSGIVVELKLEDFAVCKIKALAGMEFKSIEQSLAFGW